MEEYIYPVGYITSEFHMRSEKSENKETGFPMGFALQPVFFLQPQALNLNHWWIAHVTIGHFPTSRVRLPKGTWTQIDWSVWIPRVAVGQLLGVTQIDCLDLFGQQSCADWKATQSCKVSHKHWCSMYLQAISATRNKTTAFRISASVPHCTNLSPGNGD